MIPWKTYIFNPNRLSVGNNVYLGYNCYYGQGDIVIKDNVLIGPFVSITASNHTISEKDGSYRDGSFKAKTITIEENVWVGAHVCILAGVKIGERSLIAAGSIVTKDVPSGTVVAGCPAKVIKNKQKK
jgi:maltose O-acetyltransferase